MSQTDRQTDGRTDDSWARPRVAQLTAGPRSAAGAARLLIARLAPRLRWADRQTDTTYQPTGHPDTRAAAVLPVPSCKLGTSQADGQTDRQADRRTYERTTTYDSNTALALRA